MCLCVQGDGGGGGMGCSILSQMDRYTVGVYGCIGACICVLRVLCKLLLYGE